ncbi:MAG: GNAT family N-acetyltransferase [Anaerolineae bacterium]|nr:GNAT family N-acetyltransferase [Anaerolineae bacterium]
MATLDLTTNPIADWQQAILDGYAFPPYSWIRQVTKESRQALMRHELEQATGGNGQTLLGHVADERLTGFAQARRLEWDSRHFGIEMWRLEHLGAWGGPARQRETAEALAQAVVQAVGQRGGHSIQARAPIDNLPAVHALEGTGFRTVEVTTTWLFDLNRSPIPAKQHPALVRDVRPDDADALIALAHTAYAPTPDRFHSDPHLSSRASSELYAEWMRNSLSGALADHIAVALGDGQPVGYSTLRDLGDMGGRCNVRIAQMGLGAMMPAYRERGLVTDVVIHHLEWLRRRGGELCIVGTQGNNIPAQRVFLKAGFKPAATSLSLHFWPETTVVDT